MIELKYYSMINLNKIKPTDLWYVIGYIATDGYLSTDGRHINITSKDREHLYLIRKALHLRNKIGRKARGYEREKKYSQLQFGDINFYKYLESLGFSTKKSLVIGALNLENNYFTDFLRGIIDGDGNISTWIHKTNRNRQWCLRIFSASPIFIGWLNDRIEQNFNIKGRLYSRKLRNRDNTHYILKFGVINAKRILRIIYYCKCLSLERKFLQAQLCLQH